MPDVRVVLFLGAGFSREFGLPVMTEFADFARGHRLVDPDAAKCLSEVILEARQANSFLKSHPRNIEDILTFMEMSEQLGRNPAGRAGIIKRILRTVYSTPPRDGYSRLAEQLATMLDYPSDANRQVSEGYTTEGLSFITTNYDVNPELLLRQLKWYARLGHAEGDDVFELGSGHMYAQKNAGAVPIYKLHGGVNWFIGKDGTLQVEATMVSLSGGPIHPAISAWGTGTDRPEPVIVPPSFLKPELSEQMKSIWAGAAAELAQADHLVFIGYSFPDTDTATAYFLASALWRNSRLSQIILIDPQADRIAERLRAQGSRYGNHFTELLRPINCPWSQSTRLPIPFAWSRSARCGDSR